MPPRSSKNPDLTNMDISFDLQRLFDPYNLDHIPEDKRMSLFPQRNLSHVRHYKAAVKIFGGPHSRRRIIIAPEMETPLKHRLGEYMNKASYPVPPILSTAMKPNKDLVALSHSTSKCLSEAKLETDKLEEHRQWIKDRQKLRSDLNNMGLTQAYLERKPDKTPQEKLLMKQMIEDNKPIISKPKEVIESHLDPDPGKAVPTVKLPSPKALRQLDEFMQERKIRLIDLFTSVDKDKNWTISREEFKKAMRMHDIPLSDESIEDLVLALDTDCSDELDYRELAKGMVQFKRERRENKRKEMAQLFDSSFSTMSRTPSFGSGFRDERHHSDNSSSPNRPSSRPITKTPHSARKTPRRLHSPGKSSPALFQYMTGTSSADKSPENPPDQSFRVSTPAANPVDNVEIPVDRPALSNVREVSSGAVSTEKPRSANKSGSNSCASTPSQLALPEPDLRPEQFVLGSDEAMVDHIKVTRSILSGSAKARQARSDQDIRYPSVIKIGDAAIDNHSMFSQLEGDTGEMMNKFRQEKLREYYAVRALCQERGVSLTKQLLDKVLLHPPDKPHNIILREIRRKTGKKLLSSTFANPPKHTEDPPEVENKSKVKKVRRGRMVRGRPMMPKQRWVASKGTKMNLSTGRAFIKPSTDCWMTFEEYERLTRHLSTQYQQLHGPVNYSAFWPGFLLEKLRLCMPPYDASHPDSLGASALFHNVKQGRKSNYGYNNDLNTFPFDSQGCVKYGDIDPYLRKPLLL